MSGLGRLVCLIALLGAGGCASVTEPLGMEDPFAIPQPFAGAERNDRMIGQATEIAAVVIEPPQGFSDAVAVDFRDRLIKAAQDHDVPALAESSVRAWRLSSQVTKVMASAKPAKNKKKREAPREQGLIRWVLVDTDGQERGAFTVAYTGQEDELSGEPLRALIEQVAIGLEKALSRPYTQAATAQTAVAKPVAWIGAITGAPGDGNKSLARALQGVLPLKGIQVEDAKGNAAWRIEGVVKVAKASATQDGVVLTWRVLDGQGKEVGSLTQENAVPHGRLAKSWGEVAAFAAEAAAEGIAQLIQQVSKPEGA